MPNITERLCAAISSTRLSDFSPEAIDVAVDLFFDTTGCMLAGIQETGAKIVEDFAAEQGSGTNTIVGGKRTNSPYQAALVNGTSAAILDYDDSTWRLIGHPSGCVVPAVMALAEQLNVTGEKALEAYMVGYEAIGHIAKGTATSLYMTGRHTTAAVGVLGAAAACARMLDLPKDKTAMAMGIAGSCSGALRAGHGTMTKGLHSGNAAAQGMMSALLAAQGFTAQPDIFDHKYGFFNVSIKPLSDYTTDEVGVDWGKPWEFLQPLDGPGIKLMPSGTTSFCAGECAMHIRKNEKYEPNQIASILWETTPLAVDIAQYGVPNDRNQAFYSIGWAIAAGLSEDRVGLRQFDEDKIQDPLLRDLCSKVKIVLHPELMSVVSPDHVAGELTVTLKDGRVFKHMRRRPRMYPGGEPRNRGQLVEKFTENGLRSLKKSAIDKVIDSLYEIRKAPSMKVLMTSLRA